MQIRLRNTCLLALMILFWFSAWAQPERILEKNVFFEDVPGLGLSQRDINEIIQDSEGYLWVATWAGLIRYDGRSSEIYTVGDREYDLKSNKITSLCENESGDIWIGTRANGLFLYDRLNDHFISYSEKYPALQPFKNVWDIVPGEQGSVWLATEKGLIHLNQQEVTVYDQSDGLSFNFVTSIYKDTRQNLWLTTEYGITHFDTRDKKVIKQYHAESQGEERSPNNYFFEAVGVLYNGQERIFAASKSGLKEVTEKGLINHLSTQENKSYNAFRSLIAIKGNYPFLLVGSEKGLLTFDVELGKFNATIWGFENSNLSHNTVKTLFFDRTGVLWAGTKKGLNKFDTYDKGFRLFKNSLFDPDENIITGINGNDSDILISTIGGGLFHFNPYTEQFQPIKIIVKEETDHTDFIQKIYVDYRQNLYLGTAGGGVYRFSLADIKENNFTIRNYDHINMINGFGDDYIMSFAGSDDGGVWVGTWSGGLQKLFQDNSFHQFDDEIFYEAPIVEVLQTGNTLWVGSRGNGLYRFLINGNELKLEKTYSSQTENNLSLDFITALYLDSKNRVWVGTENGLNLFNEPCQCFEIFKMEDGLETNEVTSIMEDAEERLWLTHPIGISVLTYEEDGIQLKHHFDRSDRLQGGFFYTGVTYRNQDDLLYVGDANGFNVINPSKFETNPFEPAALITSFKVFGQELKPNDSYNDRVILTDRIQKTQEIHLKHDENSIELEFSAMHFAHPSRNKFQHQLQGFESQWHETSQITPVATYTNLPDGDYTFLLKDSNNDGLWQTAPLALKIIVQPPWWRTIWAYLLFTVMVMSLLFGFRYQIIARTTYESNLKLAELERENLEQANKAKLSFFTNVSHEFRTPLTLILGPLDHLLESIGSDNNSKQQLLIVKNNASRLLRLINQLLDFRKVETGNLNLRVANGNFAKFVKEVKLSFDLRAEELGIKFNIHTSSNVIDLYFDRDQFEKILFNLLSNSFKHTSSGGEVTIKVIEHDRTVELIVADNGLGIPKEDFNNIFNRFYSNDSTIGGTGIGLALVNSLVRMHRAEISFDSVQEEKTEFKISILKGKDHFKEEELIEDFKNSEHIEQYARDEIDPLETDLNNNNDRDILDRDKLLIVEDNKEVRYFIKSIFLKQYVILEAQNGEDALALAVEEIPDLVISDVMMPIMDGITLCKSLKTNTKTSHIPVILLTARTSLIFETEGYESGADDYISKPFSSSLLKIRVNNLIEQRKKLRRAFSEDTGLNIEPSMISYTSSDEKFIKNALESIEKNMSNSDFSVEDLGDDLGLSRMQLYRKLKAMLGLSANEFIRSVRLKRAAQLLQTKEYTISEVIYMCGFSDHKYFRKCFKKQFKVNPSEYEAMKSEELG